MALGDINITVVGNLTNDPELRFTPSGAAVASFTVAVATIDATIVQDVTSVSAVRSMTEARRRRWRSSIAAAA